MNMLFDPSKNQPDLLVVDDDVTFCQVLSQALSKRGFAVRIAHDADEAIAKAQQLAPEYAIVDLSMPGPSGLMVVKALTDLGEHTRTVVLTGYASIATAVEAIKLGAIHYLTKPTNVDDIIAAFHRAEGDTRTTIASEPMSINRMEWEHLHKVLLDCGGNISAAARRLSMHRRTLQRKLRKYPSKT